jgi:hypothetical protein
MNVNQVVIYIDPKGVPKNALVKSLNQLHEGYLSLSYQDAEGRSIDVFDVPHMDDESRQEPNPDLPTFHINCWKYPDEDHNRAPKDHPMFDHPFEPPTLDDDGRRIPKPRPEFDAVVEEHQAGKAAGNGGAVGAAVADDSNQADGVASAVPVVTLPEATLSELLAQNESLKAQSPEQSAAREHAVATAHVEAQLPKPNAAPETELPQGETIGLVTETKQYSDGSSATGVAPLPDQSPAQQDAAKAAPVAASAPEPSK